MAYSQDLRERVVGAYEGGEGGIVVLAQRFKVNKNTVHNWLKLYREHGTLEPRTGNNRRPEKLTAEQQALLRQMIDNAPSTPDHQLADALFEATGVRIHRTTVNDYWHRWGYTRKKNRLYPPKDTPTVSKP